MDNLDGKLTTLFCGAIIALAAWCLITDWIPQALRLAEKRAAQELAMGGKNGN